MTITKIILPEDAVAGGTIFPAFAGEAARERQQGNKATRKKAIGLKLWVLRRLHTVVNLRS